MATIRIPALCATWVLNEKKFLVKIKGRVIRTNQVKVGMTWRSIFFLVAYPTDTAVSRTERQMKSEIT